MPPPGAWRTRGSPPSCATCRSGSPRRTCHGPRRPGSPAWRPQARASRRPEGPAGPDAGKDDLEEEVKDGLDVPAHVDLADDVVAAGGDGKEAHDLAVVGQDLARVEHGRAGTSRRRWRNGAAITRDASTGTPGTALLPIVRDPPERAVGDREPSLHRVISVRNATVTPVAPEPPTPKPNACRHPHSPQQAATSTGASCLTKTMYTKPTSSSRNAPPNSSPTRPGSRSAKKATQPAYVQQQEQALQRQKHAAEELPDHVREPEHEEDRPTRLRPEARTRPPAA